MSPYQAMQTVQQVKQLSMGKGILNLSGSATYDPSMGCLRKVRTDGVLAADVHPYMDELREPAPTKVEACTVASIMAKAAAYFGLQDAVQNEGPPSQNPGA
ncbi:hypothetical protein ACA910_019298 [Epithemia clementina (nom. ined.)]